MGTDRVPVRGSPTTGRGRCAGIPDDDYPADCGTRPDRCQAGGPHDCTGEANGTGCCVATSPSDGAADAIGASGSRARRNGGSEPDGRHPSRPERQLPPELSRLLHPTTAARHQLHQPRDRGQEELPGDGAGRASTRPGRNARHRLRGLAVVGAKAEQTARRMMDGSQTVTSSQEAKGLQAPS
jgi:hypothetical protein